MVKDVPSSGPDDPVSPAPSDGPIKTGPEVPQVLTGAPVLALSRTDDKTRPTRLGSCYVIDPVVVVSAVGPLEDGLRLQVSAARGSLAAIAQIREVVSSSTCEVVDDAGSPLQAFAYELDRALVINVDLSQPSYADVPDLHVRRVLQNVWHPDEDDDGDADGTWNNLVCAMFPRLRACRRRP